MFKFRAIGFTLLMGLVAAIFFWQPWGGLVLFAAGSFLVTAAVWEAAVMLRNSGYPCRAKSAAFFTWIFTAVIFGISLCDSWSRNGVPASLSRCLALLLALLILGVPLISAASLLRRNAADLQARGSCALLLIALLPSFIGLLLTYFTPPAGYWLAYLCLVTKATDTGGYICGTLTAKLPGGNHKIAPVISPKKSWEGLIGGFLLSLAVAGIFYWLRPDEVDNSPVFYLVSAPVLSLGSFFGDLTESALKRMCMVKDSGNFVPGMGGALDVLDSFIYNGLIFWVIFWLFSF